MRWLDHRRERAERRHHAELQRLAARKPALRSSWHELLTSNIEASYALFGAIIQGGLRSVGEIENRAIRRITERTTP